MPFMPDLLSPFFVPSKIGNSGVSNNGFGMIPNVCSLSPMVFKGFS
jgi:hypothetical protein